MEKISRTSRRRQSVKFNGTPCRIRTYDLLITSELHYHYAIEAFGSLMGIEPMTTRATTWHSTN